MWHTRSIFLQSDLLTRCQQYEHHGSAVCNHQSALFCLQLVKLHVESKFRKALEGGSVSLVKKDENFFSFSKVTSEGDKVPFPGTFTFTVCHPSPWSITEE